MRLFLAMLANPMATTSKVRGEEKQPMIYIHTNIG